MRLDLTIQEKKILLQRELEKAKEELDQKTFFVHWLEGQLNLLDIEVLIKKKEESEK